MAGCSARREAPMPSRSRGKSSALLFIISQLVFSAKRLRKSMCWTSLPTGGGISGKGQLSLRSAARKSIWSTKHLVSSRFLSAMRRDTTCARFRRRSATAKETVSQRKEPVETRKPTHASTNSSCEFATNIARDKTMLAKERTVTHKKSDKTLEEVGSSAVGECSAKYSFQRSKRKANATKAM